MKLHFEPNLDYQLQAIEAVCDLFHGQETCRTEFTVTRDGADSQMRMGFAESDLGIGNRLTLLDDELLANLHAIQLRHGLAPSPSLESGDFTVEMETGTGKTYVYLRTVFELNKRYAPLARPLSNPKGRRIFSPVRLTKIALPPPGKIRNRRFFEDFAWLINHDFALIRRH